MKIMVIIPYFGNCPAWMDYLLQTCALNSNIQWLFYTDFSIPPDCPDNIRFESKTMDEFNVLASHKLGLSIQLKHPYKICDLRPAFGHIFSDHLEGYDFWGYADMDLVFGNISTFLTEEVLEKHDVISVREGYQAGHFALFKNDPTINGIYTRSSRYKQIFQDALYHYAFDERSSILGKKLHGEKSAVRSWLIFQYMISLGRRARLKLGPNSRNFGLLDMTSITQSLSASGEIKLYHRDLVRSDLWYEKNNIRDWEIAWKDGIVTDIKTGEEFLHFHFIKSKGTKRFHIESYHGEAEFRISPAGIMPSPNPG